MLGIYIKTTESTPMLGIHAETTESRHTTVLRVQAVVLAFAQQVLDWRRSRLIPRSTNVSSAADDLIRQLLCDPEDRLGKHASDLKQHAFFAGINWDTDPREYPAPYVPTIQHATDTSNFDPVQPLSQSHGGSTDDLSQQPTSHAFYEFTFRRFFQDDVMPWRNSSQRHAMMAEVGEESVRNHSQATNSARKAVQHNPQQQRGYNNLSPMSGYESCSSMSGRESTLSTLSQYSLSESSVPEDRPLDCTQLRSGTQNALHRQLAAQYGESQPATRPVSEAKLATLV